MKSVAYLGYRELWRDRRSDKPLYENPVVIWFEGLNYYNEMFNTIKNLSLGALLFQDYFPLGKVPSIKGEVTL